MSDEPVHQPAAQSPTKGRHRLSFQPTTLTEYITNCHRLLDLNVAVESDEGLTSKGPITSPQNKHLPSRLSAWSGFSRSPEDDSRKTLLDFSCGHEALRKPELPPGERFASRKVANERDLEHVQYSIVEDPVSNIVKVLRGHAAATRQFDLANGIVFDNQPNALSDGAEEPMRRRAAYDLN